MKAVAVNVPGQEGIPKNVMVGDKAFPLSEEMPVSQKKRLNFLRILIYQQTPNSNKNEVEM